MKKDLKELGSLLDEHGIRYALFINKYNGLLHIFNNVGTEEEIHLVVRVEEIANRIVVTLISGCNDTFRRIKKRLASVLSRHVPSILNREIVFKYKNMWQLWSDLYLEKDDSSQ